MVSGTGRVPAECAEGGPWAADLLKPTASTTKGEELAGMASSIASCARAHHTLFRGRTCGQVSSRAPITDGGSCATD